MKTKVSAIKLQEPTLVIDGSNHPLFMGLLDANGKWIAQSEQTEGAPLESLFPTLGKVLQMAQCQISDVCCFVYCEGPGSVLGLRLCAMVVKTFGHLCRPSARYFSYNSLELSGALINLETYDMKQGLLVSDWKKGSWNSISIDEGQLGALKVVNDELVNNWNQGSLFYLPQRKSWQTVPANAVTLKYSADRLPEVLHLLKPTKEVELYASSMNVFQKWVAKPHRMPK